MSWKRVKAPTFRYPTRQELRIIAASVIISLIIIVVTYFALRS